MNDDVPYGEDFHDPGTAARWADTALSKRPWRTEFFDRFVRAIPTGSAQPRRVLELGSGPGFLAEHVLARCPSIAEYTLLDFSEAMLGLSQSRLSSHEGRTTFVRADLKEPTWTSRVEGPFDAVLTMQAVHELRHKRHAQTLYAQVRSILRPGGTLLVCDHLPDGFRFDTRHALYMTVDEHLEALAGFESRACLAVEHHMALFRASA